MIPRKKERPKQEKQPRQETQELQNQLEELRSRAEGLQKEKDDIFAKLQRVAADYDNYQKRSARQIAETIAYEKEKIIKSLLPVLDDFERALAPSENAESVAEGVKIVYEHLKGILRSQGVEPIESHSERFDPTHHEAITQRSEAGKEDGVVLEELQKGYKLNGRVIRASRVIVNKAPAGEQPEQEPETKDTQ